MSVLARCSFTASSFFTSDGFMLKVSLASSDKSLVTLSPFTSSPSFFFKSGSLSSLSSTSASCAMKSCKFEAFKSLSGSLTAFSAFFPVAALLFSTIVSNDFTTLSASSFIPPPNPPSCKSAPVPEADALPAVPELSERAALSAAVFVPSAPACAFKDSPAVASPCAASVPARSILTTSPRFSGVFTESVSPLTMLSISACIAPLYSL